MKLKSVTVIGLCLTVATMFALDATADDWPRWRGPHGDGIVEADGALDAETIGLELAWSTPLGPGYSGIAVVDGRAVTMFSDGTSDVLIALDAATGEEIWRHTIGETYEGHDGSTDGPLAMPIVDGGRVYAFGPFGQLVVVELSNGEELWRVDTTEAIGAKPATYGFTTSPLVLGDTVFVETGGEEGRCHAAFDKQTGEVRWTTGEDSVGYQSPTLATLAGTEQIVAVSNKIVAGLVPSSGEILWSHEYNEDGGDGSATPVIVGTDRFLLTGGRDSALYAVEKAGSGIDVREVWRTKALKGSYAVPVLHENHFYGFDGNFLTCVEAKTGEKVWKSRPPGGQGLIMVDGHLLILNNDGELVVVRATPDGYDERARLKVGEPGSFTWPSYADGRIFVRDLEAMASVKITDAAPASAPAAEAAPRNRFEEFVRTVEAAARNKAALIDDFMLAQDGFPIIEDDRWVHVVYRGDVEDVAISGSWLEYRAEEPMDRVEGTDLYYKSFELEPGSSVEYQFNVDFENVGPDPANPRRARGSNGDVSIAALPGWKRPDFAKAYRGATPGRMDTFKHKSTVLENDRDVTVYLPAGYDSSDARYPVVIANRGEEWIDNANLPNVLDNLIGSRIAPVIGVFVHASPSNRTEYGGDKSDDYVTMVADEIVPFIDGHYRTIGTAESRLVMGAVRLGMMSAYMALSRPDVFGNAAVHTMYLPDGIGDKVIELVEGAEKPAVRFHVDWNRYELVIASADIDLGRDSERLMKALETGGFKVAGGPSNDGYGWGAWQARAGEMLLEFFPN